MFRYETHLHTFPVSRCGGATVRESLEFYKAMGYDGVFLTNHFIDANISVSRSAPYKDKIEFFFTDIEVGERVGKEIGLKFFYGIEASYGGTDFLVYGLDKRWYLEHPEIEDMKKSQELALFLSEGALVIQAHPYREASYIDHIRLYPRCVSGVEIINASNSDMTNHLAEVYADAYELPKTAGSDNHKAGRVRRLAGIETEIPFETVSDYKAALLGGETKIFTEDNPFRKDS